VKRELDNYQEVGWKADNGVMLRTLTHVDCSVNIIRDHDRRSYKVTMIFTSPRAGDKTIAIFENFYATFESLMDDFGIDDVDEVWEVLE